MSSEVPPLVQEATHAVTLARLNGMREAVHELYGPDGFEIIRALSKSDKQAVCADLLMAGLSMSQAAEALGLTKMAVSQWFARDTQDMQRLMKTALTKDALLEIPKSWNRLKELRESENEETSRKATLDAMRAAGLAIDSGGTGGQISINAQNLQFNHLSVQDLDRRIFEIADKIGPEAVKLAKAEVKGDAKSSAPARDVSAGGEPPRRDGEVEGHGGVPGASGSPPPA